LSFQVIIGTCKELKKIGSDSPSPTQTELITDVGDLSRAFILQSQQRNADTSDSICETGERVWLSDTDTLSFNHETTTEACAYNGNMNRVVWILSNSNTETGKKMIVEHQTPEDQLNTVDPNPPEEENWQVTIDSLTYGTDETSILGFTSNSDGTSTNYPSGTIVADLTSSTLIDFWQSESSEEQSYSFSAVQWPRSLVISIATSESLSLSDDMSIDLRLSLTEDLSLDDGIVDVMNAASVSLIENLDLEDTIDKIIPISLTENLTLVDDIDRTFTISLDESLSLQDDINRTFTASLTENLTLVDDIDRTFTASLTENLTLVDDINRTFTASLTENLTLADAIDSGVDPCF